MLLAKYIFLSNKENRYVVEGFKLWNLCLPLHHDSKTTRRNNTANDKTLCSKRGGDTFIYLQVS